MRLHGESAVLHANVGQQTNGIMPIGRSWRILIILVLHLELPIARIRVKVVASTDD
jgi:hypothetical protein